LDNARETFTAEMAAWLPQLGLALVTLIVSWLLARLAYELVGRLGHHKEMRGPLLHFFARLARVGVMLFGVVTALGTLGVNIAGLVAGLGLTGFALGFALKDSIANLLAGMLVIIYRPFELGDHIDVAGFAGRVTNVDLRYTELDAESERLLLPNSRLLTDPIKVQKNPAG
jgi:small conductance mechanosensitive channel